MNELVLKTMSSNLPLIVLLAIFYWKATPYLIRATLSNGGGEIVRRIVKEENASQSMEHQSAFTLVRERLAVLESRLGDHMAERRTA